MMFRRWLAHPVVAVASLILAPGSAAAKEYKLYYRGGQSDMDGDGRNSELPC